MEVAGKSLDIARPEHRLKSVPPAISRLSAHRGIGFSLWKPLSATSTGYIEIFTFTESRARPALDYDEGMCTRAAQRASLSIAVLMGATCAQTAAAQTANFELTGRIQPPQSLAVHLQGATTPFNAATEADLSGRFHFRKLAAGTYIVIAGGIQRTVEVGPSLADSKGRVAVTIDLRNAEAEKNFDRQAAFPSANFPSLKRRGVNTTKPKKRWGGRTWRPQSRT